MIDIRTKLTEDGRIEIPPEYWQALGWHIGDELILRLEEDGEAHILTLQQAIKRARGAGEALYTARPFPCR